VKRAVFAVVLLLAAGGGTAWYLYREEPAPSGYQGYVEGNLVHMAPEEGGRIERLAVEAGDQVGEAQLLFALEASAQRAQVAEAKARLGQAEAQLQNLRAAGQRPEQVAVLEAARLRAQAAVEFSQGDLQRQRTLFDRGYSSKARLDQAEASFERDKAALQEAERQIAAAQLSGRSSEILAAEAAVQAAAATLQQAETHLAKREVQAPAAARVQDVYYRAGEVVNPGQPVLALLPPANLKIRFFVPEPVLATLSLGQTVSVTCDSCGEDLRARVTFLSQEAEFTPPVIFSEQERSKLVFRAEARPLSEITLPLGLPVTVRPLDMAAVASKRS
jgi:HlyD family secretion protein